MVDDKVTERALQDTDGLSAECAARVCTCSRAAPFPGRWPTPWRRACRRSGWHVQLQLDGRLLPEREAQIRSRPGRIVIDHVGKFLSPSRLITAAFHCLLRLVDSGRVW